jgi:hypothetical protein
VTKVQRLAQKLVRQGLLPGRLRRCVPPRGPQRHRLGRDLQGAGGQEGRRLAMERAARLHRTGCGDPAAQGRRGQPDDEERRRVDEVRPGTAGDGDAGGRRVSACATPSANRPANGRTPSSGWSSATTST